MTQINKLGQFVTINEFQAAIDKAPGELSSTTIKGFLDNALINGSRVTSALDKLQSYAKLFNLTTLSRHEALVALNGSIPVAPQDLLNAEKTLTYLLEGSDEARNLIANSGGSRRSKVSYTEILDKAMHQYFASTKPTQSFSWNDIKRVCTVELKLNSQDLLSVHGAWSRISKDKNLLSKVDGTERDKTLWLLTPDAQKKFGSIDSL